MDNFVDSFEKYSFPLRGLVRLPEVKISKEDKKAIGLSENASNRDYLKRICWNGYLKKSASKEFGNFSKEEVIERLKTEFEVFDKTGTIDYFLLLWDINRWCDENGIVRGLGRGSSGGSLALYFLNITNINPLKHTLFFTRFLSEARTKPKIIDGVIYVDGKTAPDVDGDYQYERRPEVIQYIEKRYPGQTCKISTRLQLTGRTALKDVLKVYLNYDETRAKNITDFIETKFGTVEDLSTAYEERKDLQDWVKQSKENQRAFEIARSLESLNIAKGQHPSGVFISYHQLDRNIPTELSKTKEVVTSYDMNVAATQGVKADILGLRTLDLINEVCKLVKINVNDIDVNHPSIYEYYTKTSLFFGLFQIEKGLTKDYVCKIKPRNIDELSACVAISRPGALKYVDQFKDYVQSGKIKPIYPKLDELLKPTGGIILYQENITEICQKLFGMSGIDADGVRYCVGKKLKDEMQKIEPILYKKGAENNIPEEIVKYFWDTCNASADYLFVKAHAYEYAYLTAMTTYLKANHPTQFIFALLKLSKDEPNSQEVLSTIISEADQLKIKILPPDLIKSGDDFTVENDKDIRFGLSHIRGISDATMQKFASFKRDFKNKFEIFEAAQQAKISISVLTGLIYCGALETQEAKRSKLALEAQAYNLLTDKEKLLVHKMALEYNNDLLEILSALKDRKDEKNKPYIRASRFETFKRDYEPYKKLYIENSKNEELCSYIMEKHYLGFSYSSTLYSIYSKHVEGLTTIDKIPNCQEGERIRFAAFVEEAKKGKSQKSKKDYVKLFVYDETGKAKTMLYGNDKLIACEQLYGHLPDKDDIVIIHARKSNGDMLFIDNIVIQENPIKLKRSKTDEI